MYIIYANKMKRNFRVEQMQKVQSDGLELFAKKNAD